MENERTYQTNQTELTLTRRYNTIYGIGIFLCVTSLILFFIGAFVTATNPLWISAAVIGGVAALLFAVSAHSTKGWIRMFSVLFMEIVVIICTIMAVRAF